jgi:hypothetical protein
MKRSSSDETEETETGEVRGAGMNVTAIQMKPEEAQVKLDAYREVLSSKHTAAIEEEFNAALVAYQELAKGTPLVDPISAIRECGWRPDGRPMLAIGRADQKMVHWTIPRNSRRWNTDRYVGAWSPLDWRFEARSKRWSNQRAPSLCFDVPAIKTEPPQEPKNATAMVPMVPADVYPAHGLDLAKHFVLWEVEDWAFAPPKDPMLLKPIGGNLYAVVAQWDLTEIERLIIAGTRQEKR